VTRLSYHNLRKTCIRVTFNLANTLFKCALISFGTFAVGRLLSSTCVLLPMTSARPLPLPVFRDAFQWDRRFCVRRPNSYRSEDTRVPAMENETAVTAFLSVWSSVLDPPNFNYELLASFLNQANVEDLNDLTRNPTLSTLALIDDRRDPAGLREGPPGQPGESNGQTRNWESDQYARWPPVGENVFQQAGDERQLHQRLVQDVILSSSPGKKTRPLTAST